MKHILIIDNYDSFSYNLVHLLEEMKDVTLDIVRNKNIPSNILEQYDGVLVSPGPGIPQEAGNLMNFLSDYIGKISIFGVCLGHQAIAESLGGSIQNTSEVYHGIASSIQNLSNEKGILKDLGNQFTAARYHSWIVNEIDLPSELEVTAKIEDGTIMAMEHQTYPLYSVQFHPESILTPDGKKIIQNWINSIAA